VSWRLLSDLSLRYKIPLRAVTLVFLTATVLTASLLAREYRQMREDLLESAARWTGVLGQTLVSPMRHDDVWRAYEIIRAATGPADAADLAKTITLVDAERRVFVSTDPDRHPILAPLHELGEAGRAIDAELAQDRPVPRTIEAGDQLLFVLTPITADGVLLGHVLLEYSTSIFASRFIGMWGSATLVTLVVLVLIVPVSAYWGRRMADPLVDLADCMGKIGTSVPEVDECRLHVSRDEVGQLSAAMRRLILELRQKQALEQEMMFSERLAAVGRLAGGIAHEINNPLGGMLNAISTYQKHGVGDPELTAKTMSLLDRGLRQIRDTVSALLVEAKAPGHMLAPHDLADVRTLIAPDAEAKSVRFEWSGGLDGEIALPATLVRQVLINLLLNALNATERGGRLECRLARAGGCLEIHVGNDGAHIPAERIPYLFEPYVDKGRGGHGLGLWITYQIVRELGGEIGVQSDPGWTVFAVRLPFDSRTEEPR
jgi:signal transduction histidine kinase